MQGSILQTKCMALELITLPMGIGMKVHGTREKSKVLECIHLGIVKHSLDTGIVVCYRLPVRIILNQD